MIYKKISDKEIAYMIYKKILYIKEKLNVTNYV